MIESANRLKNVGEYYFSRKLELIRRMQAAGKDVINLGIGSPDLPPSASTLQAASTALHDEKKHGYAPSRSTPELRRAIAEWYLRTYQVKLDPDREVLPLLGSKEGILYLSLAFLNPGDTVLVPNPGYPAYTSVAGLIGARVLHYDLNEANGWLPDFKALESQDLSNCRLMWVNYPHMPTGASARPGLFSELVEFARRKKILVCNDNPYGLVLNQTPPQSILAADPAHEWSVELNSLSKSFNMAGWRVGMALGPNAVIEAMLQVKSNVDSGMFPAIQAGAIEALKNPDSWHEERNRIYAERREVVWRMYDCLGLKFDRTQVGMFVWGRAPETVASVPDFVEEILEQAHVFLIPGMIFGSNGDRYVRCSLCAPLKRLQEALARIERFVGARGGAT